VDVIEVGEDDVPVPILFTARGSGSSARSPRLLLGVGPLSRERVWHS
jgi:hypothetical protein